MTELKDGTAGVESVHGETDRQARETLFEALGETGESLQFAILLGRIGRRVLDEFAHQRADQSVVSDQFGFQHVVIIEGLSVARLACQTVWTVALVKGVDAGAVNQDDVVLIQEAIAGQDFMADQVCG